MFSTPAGRPACWHSSAKRSALNVNAPRTEHDRVARRDAGGDAERASAAGSSTASHRRRRAGAGRRRVRPSRACPPSRHDGTGARRRSGCRSRGSHGSRLAVIEVSSTANSRARSWSRRARRNRNAPRSRPGRADQAGNAARAAATARSTSLAPACATSASRVSFAGSTVAKVAVGCVDELAVDEQAESRAFSESSERAALRCGGVRPAGGAEIDRVARHEVSSRRSVDGDAVRAAVRAGRELLALQQQIGQQARGTDAVELRR